MTIPDRPWLKVFGPAGGYPYAGYACAGYLLKVGGSNILLDCGPGVATKLLASMKACDLDAVVITHMHPDHVLDVVALGYALMTEWVAQKRCERVVLWVQPGGREFLDTLVGLFGHRHWRLSDDDLGPGYAQIRSAAAAGDDWFFSVFDVREYAPGEGWTIGDTRIETLPVPHTAPCIAIRAEANGRTLVYTGDTRRNDALVDFAAGADVLVAEAHFSGSHPPGNGHMSPAEAAELARRAGVGRLILCHLASPDDGPAALMAVRGIYDGPVDLALALDEVAI